MNTNFLSAFVADHLNKLYPDANNKLPPDWAKDWGVFNDWSTANLCTEKAALTLVCVGFGIQKTLNNAAGDRHPV